MIAILCAIFIFLITADYLIRGFELEQNFEWYLSFVNEYQALHEPLLFGIALLLLVKGAVEVAYGKDSARELEELRSGLEEQKRQEKETLGHLTTENAVLSGKVKELHEETSRLSSGNAELADKSRALQEQLEKRAEEALEATNQVRELEQQRDALQQAKSELQERVSASQKRASAERTTSTEIEIVNLLRLLQEKGRFIDFVMGDVTSYTDEQVGRASRVVHQGCRNVIQEYFEIAPFAPQKEGSSITLAQGYDASLYKLIGNVSGKPPFSGRLLHPGWHTKKVSLPRVQVKGNGEREQYLIAPAEVEIK